MEKILIVLIAALTLAVVAFGGYAVINSLLLGGIMDLYVGMTTLGDMTIIIVGITKVICAGPAALLVIWVVQECLKLIDRLHGWKAGRV